MADLNAGHYQCEVFRYSPIQLPLLLLVQRAFLPSLLPPTSRAEPFFAPGPLVILFPRRFSKFSRPAPPSGIVGFLSEICTVRPAFPGHLPLPSRSPVLPLVPANRLSRGSGYGNGYRRRSLRVSGSFCFCSAFHRRGRIGNAYFITARRLTGSRGPLSPTTRRRSRLASSGIPLTFPGLRATGAIAHESRAISDASRAELQSSRIPLGRARHAGKANIRSVYHNPDVYIGCTN